MASIFTVVESVVSSVVTALASILAKHAKMRFLSLKPHAMVCLFHVSSFARSTPVGA